MLQAALNGSRAASEHPALPLTPESIALEARRAVAAGAAELHLHVRREDGKESLEPAPVARTLELVRAACPGTPIGLSTAEGIMRDVQTRYDCVASWTVLPDYVSVNVHERGTGELMRLLLDRGIAIEAGVWNPRAAEQLMTSGLAEQCLRVLVEAHEPELDAARANAQAIEGRLDRLGIRLPRLLHGLDAPAWPLLEYAIVRGYDTRAGMEDMLTLPDGSPADGNAAIIRAAARLIRRFQ